MTTEILDRAEISGENVIVEYSATEAALAALRQKYAGIVFDLTTVKGDKEARAARLELTTLRTSLEKKRKQFKAPALEFGKKIDSEASRVTAEILALEYPIDDQIKADEARRAAEKAERDRIAAERAQGFRNRIAVIRSFVGKCSSIASERIAKGIAQVEQVDVSAAAFEEFAAEAASAKDETLIAMRQIMAETKAREEEAARVEAQRIENERVAAEQKARADALAAQQAEIDRQSRELREAQEAQAKAEADRIRKDAQDRTMANLLAEKEYRQARNCPPQPAKEAVSPAEPEQLSMVEPAPDNGARLKLGELNARLAPLSISADGLAELGFPHVATEKAAKLYRASDWPAICAALAKHLTEAGARPAA
jgi:hypothetical protein